MKNQQQEEARNLFLQSNLSKTEIAAQLGVNRRTIYQWSVDGDWQTLRASARCMPSILAQKVYHLIGHFTDHLLQRDVAYQSVTKDDVYILSKLVTAVTKLRSGSTASENMETFTLFLEGMKQKDAGLAQEVAPHVNEFITAKATMAHNSFLLDGYEQNSGKPFSEKDLLEKWQDEKDHDAILAEQRAVEPQYFAATHPTDQTQDVTSPQPTGHNDQDEPETLTYSNGVMTWTKPNPKYKPANPATATTSDSQSTDKKQAA